MGQAESRPSRRAQHNGMETRADPNSSIYKQPSLLNSLIRASAGYDNLNKAFLKIHRPDRSEKCLIDPSDVMRFLRNQAEEILRMRGFVTEQRWEIDTETQYYDEDRSWDVMSGFLSNSEMTSATHATRPTTNVSRSQGSGPTRAFSKTRVAHGNSMANSMKEEEDSDFMLRAPKGSMINRTDNEKVPNNMIVQVPCQSIRLMHARKAERETDIWSKYVPALLGACMTPKDDLQLRREEYMSVLHLRMKAHLGKYYTQRYLPSLPDPLIVPGVNQDEVTMISDDSSSSSASQEVEFGMIPPSTPVLSVFDESVFMDLAVTGSLGLVPRHGHGKRRISPCRPDQKSPDHYLVLINRRSGVPLAVCAMKSHDGPPIVRIYATKQRVSRQRPAATTHQLGLDWATNLPLYSWAEIVTTGMYPNPLHFAVYMASGSQGFFSRVPSYRASFVADDTPSVTVVGRTDNDTKEAGCAVITAEADGLSGSDDFLSFQMHISQGIDPAFMICFTAVMDEVIEKAMRMHYKEHAESEPRRGRRRNRFEI